MKPIANLPDRIFLCGFMGTGKSTIGKKLAQQLGMSFADLDKMIEGETGKTIPEIFEEEGEKRFRSLEKAQLLKAVKSYKGVLALGGGSLRNQHLIDHLKITGLLIFIETPFSVIFQRITKNKKRPLLLNEDGSLKDPDILKNNLQQLYESRLKFYRQSELTIQPEDRSTVEQTTATLLRKIRNHVSHH